MHPPRFLRSQRLSDWPECFLEIACPLCEQRSFTIAVKGLLRWYGDRAFAEVLARLRCKFCRRKPGSVLLHASYGRENGGQQTSDWTLTIFPTSIDQMTGH
jgi:hypothetical protein